MDLYKLFTYHAWCRGQVVWHLKLLTLYKPLCIGGYIKINDIYLFTSRNSKLCKNNMLQDIITLAPVYVSVRLDI